MVARRIGLHAADVSLVLDVSQGGLPAVLYWGAALGELSPADLDALESAQRPMVHDNAPDVALRYSLLPEGEVGWLGHPGLTGSRGGRDWSPHWTLSRVSAAGQSLDGDVNLGPAAVDFVARDQASGLEVGVVVEMLPQGLVRARARVTNLDVKQDYRVDQLLVAFPVPQRASETLDFAGRWLKERIPQRSVLQVGTHWRESRHGCPGADSAFVLHLGTPGFSFAGGEIWSVHTAWSGNGIHYAEKLLSGDQVIGGGELLLPDEGRLAPGQSYQGPWVYANYGLGLDAVARRFHRWLRSRPQHPGAQRPVTLNVWEAVYFDHDEVRLLDLAQRAADVGVERFVLDDGWFGARRNDHAGLGDWVVSDQAWPQGLHRLVNRVNELGMEFGLWFEPEMVNLDSDVARAHPDWVMNPGHGRWPVESRHQQVLNIGIPEAYAHVRDQMMAILAEYPIAYLKWDHNRDLIEAGTGSGGEPGVHNQTLAYYRLVDELKAAHPGLEIESCASGGARIDLEVMSRCDRVWVSDCIDPVERLQINRWTTQLLPLEMCGSHIASGISHTTGRRHGLSFRAGVAVFGHLGIEWDLATATDAELGELKQWIGWYRANRGVLNTGDLVRVDPGDPGAWLYGVVSSNKAIYAYCRTETPALAGLGELLLPGLAPDARYRVSVCTITLDATSGARIPAWVRQSEPITLTGRMLAQSGLRTPWLLPEHCLLIEAERV